MIKSDVSRNFFFTLLIFTLLFCSTYTVASQEIKDNNITATQEDLIQSERDITNSETDSTDNQLSNEKNNDLEEEFDLDEQSYEGDDDDFIPTEEVPADEPIPFPTNI
jgi:hypothetical protein